jgi:flagellar biosynthesis/type III secretory pathway chaperone
MRSDRGMDAMDRFIEQLIAALEQTERLYSRMLEIIEEEKIAATLADTQRLSVAGTEKQDLMAQLGCLDLERTRLLQQLAEVLGVPCGRLDLSTLADHVGQPYRDTLRALNAGLRHVINKVHSANEECCALIRHCLKLVQNTLGFFQHCMGSVDVYGASGNMRDPSLRNGRLLSGEV